MRRTGRLLHFIFTSKWCDLDNVPSEFTYGKLVLGIYTRSSVPHWLQEVVSAVLLRQTPPGSKQYLLTAVEYCRPTLITAFVALLLALGVVKLLTIFNHERSLLRRAHVCLAYALFVIESRQRAAELTSELQQLLLYMLTRAIDGLVFRRVNCMLWHF